MCTRVTARKRPSSRRSMRSIRLRGAGWIMPASVRRAGRGPQLAGRTERARLAELATR